MNEAIFLGILIWLFISSVIGMTITSILEIFDLQDLVFVYCDLIESANILGYIIILIITLFFLPPLLLTAFFVLIVGIFICVKDFIVAIAFNKNKE